MSGKALNFPGAGTLAGGSPSGALCVICPSQLALWAANEPEPCPCSGRLWWALLFLDCDKRKGRKQRWEEGRGQTGFESRGGAESSLRLALGGQAGSLEPEWHGPASGWALPALLLAPPTWGLGLQAGSANWWWAGKRR